MKTQTFLSWVEDKLDGTKEEHYEQFDVINNKSFSQNSRITTFPIAKGEQISDHIFTEPLNYSLSGVFAVRGKVTKTSLKEKEDLLRKIQKQGSACSIIIMNDDEEVFSRKTNLFITNINFNPGPSNDTITASMNLKEVIFATFDKLEVQYNLKEKNLPNVVDPASLSVTETILKQDEILQTLVRLNYEQNFVTLDFLQQFNRYIETVKNEEVGKVWAKIGKGVLAVGIGSATALASIAGGIVVIGLAISAGISSTGVGIIAGAVIAVAVAAIYGCIKLWEWFTEHNKFKIKKFEKQKNSKKQQEENDRYLAYLMDVYLSFEQLSSKVRIYSLPSNENCSVFITIKNKDYEFCFKKNDVGSGITLTIIDSAANKNIFNSPVCPKDSYADLSTSDNVMSSIAGQYIYLIKANPDKDATDISNIYIFCPGRPIQEFNQTIIDILKASFLR